MRELEIVELERRNAALVTRNRELEGELQAAADIARALVANEVDAIVVKEGSTPILLRAAQDALRERELILRGIFDGALDAILLTDDDGRCVDANPAASDLFGLSRERLLGRTIAELTSTETGIASSNRDELALTRPEGSRRVVEQSAVANIASGVHLTVLHDITRRKAQEAALREARHFLEQAEAVAQVGCWVVPVDSAGPVFWTKESYRIIGLPEETPLTLRIFIDQVVHAADRESVEVSLRNAMASRAPFELEHRIVRPDGEVRWLHLRAVFDTPENGDPGRVIGTFQDVTERRTSIDQLRASEERYRRIIDTTSDGVWLSDENYVTTFVNQRLADMLGYSRAEMIGQPVFPFLTEEGRQRAVEKFERRKTGAADNYENAYRRKDGTTCWALARTNAIRDENGVFGGTVGLLTNLTEQRAVEVARDRLAAIVESSGDAIISSTPEGKITSWNHAAEELFGYTAAEVMGQPASLLIPPGRMDEEPTILERVSRGEHLAHCDTVRRRKDGSLVDVSIHVSLIRDPDGHIVGASKIARDISERRSQEAALRRSEEQLRQSSKMEAIGSLAGGIAHDFNNILSVILGYTNLTVKALDPSDPMRADLEEVHKAGIRAAGLTSQLLAFSRQQMLQPDVLDLNRTIEGVKSMLVRTLGEDLVLSLRLSNALGSVYADVGQIEQVLMNLVINARDAMPRGGTITIETSNVVLDAEAARRGVALGTYSLLAVTDTGTGMDEATVARIFDPFFSTKETGKGTGLGLSTAHGIVEQSGGHIVVHSELGKGTRFEVYLPQTSRAPSAQPSLRPSLASGASYRGDETILLVEDQDDVRNVMRSILRQQGYEVLEAQNGGEAFLISEKHASKIHLLLTDVVMPRMSGAELAELLVARRPDIGVLFVSGYAKDAAVRHGVLDEGRAFLAKPMTPEALARKVREVLDTPLRLRP